jgi:hypothetical protein
MNIENSSQFYSFIARIAIKNALSQITHKISLFRKMSEFPKERRNDNFFYAAQKIV